MSGKSTFLRSLGVNMVLAGIGSPICASKANIHPVQVWVFDAFIRFTRRQHFLFLC